MAAADDEMKVSRSVNVECNHLKLNVNIKGWFINDDDDTAFVDLTDIRNSRALAKVLTCRVSAGKSIAKRTIVDKSGVIKHVRTARDQALHKHIKDALPHGCVMGKNTRIKPSCRRARVHFLAMEDSVAVQFPSIGDAVPEATIKCLTVHEGRKNGNTKVWVEANASSFTYLSKFVAHRFSSTDARDSEGIEQNNEGNNEDSDAEDNEESTDDDNISNGSGNAHGKLEAAPQAAADVSAAPVLVTPVKQLKQSSIFDFCQKGCM